MDGPSLMCERARRWSSLRLDGELSELESALLDSHLGRCSSCRAFARGAEGVAALLSAVRLERPAPLALSVPRTRRAKRAMQSFAIAALVLCTTLAAAAAGIARPQGSAHAAKPVAMVSTLDTPNELRELRRQGLIEQNRALAAVPRNRQTLGES
jgi:predicted anti-sigma-YlaC factor YlaD